MPVPNKMGQYVSLHMIHSHKGNSQGNGERFGEGGAYEQRAQKPRALGESDAIQHVFLDPCLFQGLVHNRNDIFLMCPGGQFGNHSAIVGMNLLTGYDIGQNHVVLKHCGARLIAG